MTSVMGRKCWIVAAADERMQEAGNAGGQVVLLLASTLLLYQHTCHAQTLVKRYPVSKSPLKSLSGDSPCESTALATAALGAFASETRIIKLALVQCTFQALHTLYLDEITAL